MEEIINNNWLSSTKAVIVMFILGEHYEAWTKGHNVIYGESVRVAKKVQHRKWLLIIFI